MSETPQQWAKRMRELTEKTPQFCFQRFIERYSEREKDYGVIKFYGPFTEEELDEYDISHSDRTKVSEQIWITSFDLSATYDEAMDAFTRFIKEQRPAEYEQFRKAKE